MSGTIFARADSSMEGMVEASVEDKAEMFTSSANGGDNSVGRLDDIVPA